MRHAAGRTTPAAARVVPAEGVERDLERTGGGRGYGSGLAWAAARAHAGVGEVGACDLVLVAVPAGKGSDVAKWIVGGSA